MATPKGMFIDGWFYAADQVEQGPDGVWRVKRARPVVAVVDEPIPEGPPLPDPIPDDPEAKDEDLSIPGPPPLPSYGTKIVKAKS